MEQRQAACTHTSMTRLFDMYGSCTCQMCHRHPSIGYLYCCTQDHDGVLPESEFGSTSLQRISTRLSDDPVSHQLSAWILEGILGGQYTAQQIQTIWQQKQGVRNAIIAQEEKMAAQSPSSSSDQSASTSSSDIDLITILTDAIPDDSIETSAFSEESSFTVEHVKRTTPSSAGGGVDTGSNGMSYKPLNSLCSWKCCQTCRPTYRDRAYQSLNAIVDSPNIRGPPAWELENRRISNASVVAQLGLPKLRHVYLAYDDLREAGTDVKGSGEDLPTESESEKLDDLDYGVTLRRRRGGFRGTIKKALGGLANKNDSISQMSKTSSKSSSQESFKRFSRAMLFKRRAGQSGLEPSGCVVDDGPLQESLTLMIAKNTPLPVEELEGGEVEVEDGVALTEEGVGMDAADIIMQV